MISLFWQPLIFAWSFLVSSYFQSLLAVIWTWKTQFPIFIGQVWQLLFCLVYSCLHTSRSPRTVVASSLIMGSPTSWFSPSARYSSSDPHSPSSYPGTDSYMSQRHYDWCGNYVSGSWKISFLLCSSIYSLLITALHGPLSPFIWPWCRLLCYPSSIRCGVPFSLIFGILPSTPPSLGTICFLFWEWYAHEFSYGLTDLPALYLDTIIDKFWPYPPSHLLRCIHVYTVSPSCFLCIHRALSNIVSTHSSHRTHTLYRPCRLQRVRSMPADTSTFTL